MIRHFAMSGPAARCYLTPPVGCQAGPVGPWRQCPTVRSRSQARIVVASGGLRDLRTLMRANQSSRLAARAFECWILNPAAAQPVDLDVLCPGRMDASWPMLPAAARLQNAPRRYQPVIVRHHPPLCRFLVIVRGMRLERGADSRPHEAGWRCRHRLSRLPPELRQDCETDNANHCQRDCTNQHYTSSFEGQSGNHPLTFAETGYGRGLRSIP